MWRALAGGLLWLLLATGADARDWFVNNVTGSDRNDGLAARVTDPGTGPFRTLARALRAADKGDRIIVANTGQAYRESITLQAGRHSGFELQPFVIVGNGAVLDGAATIPQEAWEHVAGDVYRYEPLRKGHHLLFLDGLPLMRRPAADSLPELQALEWALVRGFVYFRAEPGRVPWLYPLSRSELPVGITLYEVRHVVLSDLVVQGFQLDGVNAFDGVFDATLVGLTARGNGRAGISVGGASRVDIVACLVGDNAEAQVRTEGHSQTRIINSDLVETTAPGLVRQGGRVLVESDEPAEAE